MEAYQQFKQVNPENQHPGKPRKVELGRPPIPAETPK
jgi:hypothetical protein